MKRTVGIVTAVVVAWASAAVAPARAAQGGLDPSFGKRGKAVTDFGGSDGIVAIAVGSRIIAAGGSSGNVALARYLSNGSLDSSFGRDGLVVTDLGSDFDAAVDVVITRSHRYLVLAHGSRTGGGGSQFNQSFMLRYGSGGRLDPRFGDGGVLTLDPHLFGRAMALQPDGKIIIAGDSMRRTDFMVERLLRSGRPDLTFGGDGKIVTDFGLQSHAYDVVVQPDGKILVVGWSYFPGGGSTRDKPTLARYRPNGGLDRTFGTNGKAVGATSSAFPVGAALQSTGKIVIAASPTWGRTSGCFSSYEDLLLRFDPRGELDATFGHDGQSRVPSVASAVTIEPDDHIVVVGYGCPSGKLTFAVSRYQSDGALDRRFGHDGTASTALGANSLASSVAVEAKGKILVGGETLHRTFEASNFGLARYLA